MWTRISKWFDNLVFKFIGYLLIAVVFFFLAPWGLSVLFKINWIVSYLLWSGFLIVIFLIGFLFTRNK
jgi:hypothetical protein